MIKRGIQMTNKHIKRWPILSISEIHIKMTMKSHYIAIKMAKKDSSYQVLVRVSY